MNELFSPAGLAQGVGGRTLKNFDRDAGVTFWV